MSPPTKGKLGGDETSDDMTVTTDTPHDDADSTPDSETTTTYTIPAEPTFVPIAPIVECTHKTFLHKMYSRRNTPPNPREDLGMCNSLQILSA